MHAKLVKYVNSEKSNTSSFWLLYCNNYYLCSNPCSVVRRKVSDASSLYFFKHVDQASYLFIILNNSFDWLPIPRRRRLLNGHCHAGNRYLSTYVNRVQYLINDPLKYSDRLFFKQPISLTDSSCKLIPSNSCTWDLRCLLIPGDMQLRYSTFLMSIQYHQPAYLSPPRITLMGQGVGKM